MSRRQPSRGAACLAAWAWTLLFATTFAVAQEKPASPARGDRKEQPGQESKSLELFRDAPIEAGDRPRDGVTDQIEKWFKAYDLKPRRLPPIPDEPPPHEGAMIDLPLVVEPPDLVLIEVLEALPGRPISGERLIRPDGNINLGFYGDVYVRGLSLPQLKVALIKHLRRYLDDETLGLRVYPDAGDPPQGEAGAPLIGPPTEQGAPPAGKKEDGARPAEPDQPRPRFVSPVLSTRVFVDITAYNTRFYHVMGDVLVPGRLPCTGKETGLDALEFAGGLLPTADPKDVRLVRPGRDGKPTRVYKVDLEAIQEKGEARSNYRLFPDDRLIFGRNAVVKTTIEIDRLNAPIQAVINTIRQETEMLKSLGALPADRGDRVLKNLVDFWAKEMAREGGVRLDEATLREALLRQLRPAPAASPPGPK